MSGLFIETVNRSLAASWLILAVLLLRLLLKRAPKCVNVLLWGAVAVRLVCPFSFESPVSLIPDSVVNSEFESEWMDNYVGEVSVIQNDSVYYEAAIAAGREPVSDGNGGFFVVTGSDLLSEPSTVGNTVLPVCTGIWIVGLTLLVLYAAVSYLCLRRKVDTAVLCEKNIYRSENVSSPFVLGIIRPTIYLPFRLNGQDFEYVVAHERAHIRRKDHWWKPLGFLLLTIHWFNPVMWLAYSLLCRDIELACDEKVIADLGAEQRADYTQALVACSVKRHMIAACPIAFGEVGVKERVKSVLNYKKPAFWMVFLAVLACVVVTVCFLTDPAGKKPYAPEKNFGDPFSWNGEIIPGTTYVPYRCIYLVVFSSYHPDGGNSGFKYVVGEDYFLPLYRNADHYLNAMNSNPELDTVGGRLDGLQSVIGLEKDTLEEYQIEGVKWEWQDFPYTDEEWSDLFCFPLEFEMIKETWERYNEILYQPLSESRFLLKMDSELWLVDLKKDSKLGTYIYDIYSLVPESTMGVAQWEYAPELNSRCPYFRFDFDMDYAEISAVCLQSPLVDFDAPEKPTDTSLLFQKGNAMYWSPVSKDGNVVRNAIIRFAVNRGGKTAYEGTIYIEGNSGSDGRRIYKASIVGNGLHLSPNSETEGGVISAISSADALRVVEHDLTKGNLEVSVEDLANYVFYTNSTKISVTVHGDGFKGQVNLLDISQNNAQIMQAKVNNREDDCLFTGLTSARLYRVQCEGLDGCTVRISGDNL